MKTNEAQQLFFFAFTIKINEAHNLVSTIKFVAKHAALAKRVANHRDAGPDRERNDTVRHVLASRRAVAKAANELRKLGLRTNITCERTSHAKLHRKSQRQTQKKKKKKEKENELTRARPMLPGRQSTVDAAAFQRCDAQPHALTLLALCATATHASATRNERECKIFVERACACWSRNAQRAHDENTRVLHLRLLASAPFARRNCCAALRCGRRRRAHLTQQLAQSHQIALLKERHCAHERAKQRTR